MDFEVPLNRLIFGQEDGAGINARVTGRQDGIAELAANLHANGQIENLVVKLHGPDNGAPVPEGYTGPLDVFAVSNGNRRLAAFRMIHSEASTHLVRVTSHDVDDKTAFEHSLATAVTAKQLHPVDQYEGFVRLQAQGKTNEEVARQYGKTEKEVRQVLALGGLSPKIREAWRNEEISAETAQAFTMAKDVKAQDKVFAKLSKEEELSASSVRHELGIKSNGQLVELINFITPDLYRSRGGDIVEDLFGEHHSVSDEVLVKTLAAEELDRHCGLLVAAGWSWAKPLADLPTGAAHWEESPVADKDMVWFEGEKERHNELDKKLTAMENDSSMWDYEEQERLEAAIAAIDREVRGRSFNDKQKAKLGCVVDIVDGALEVTYGVMKPAEQLPVKKGVAQSEDDGLGAPTGPVATPAKEATTISNALADRLGTQLLHATKDALLAETAGAHPLFKMLAGIVVEQIRPEQKFHMPPAVNNKLKALREELEPKAMNAAVSKRFDAKDYFSGAPKVIVLKAIKEAINADEARKLTTSTKAEIGKFAIANVVKAGWVPKELRTVHYAGPGSEGYKRPAPGKRSEPLADEKTTVLPPKAAAKSPAKSKTSVKRAAATKKAAKKTSKKKR